MESIKTIYRIGNGPSSSHTMGPERAAAIYLNKHPNADGFIVTLYGSLALTGKGHLTDYIITKTLGTNRTKIIFDYDTTLKYHPNGMKFQAVYNHDIKDDWLVFSVGGGSLKLLDEKRDTEPDQTYPEHNMNEILKYCQLNKLSLIDYIKQHENEETIKYIEKVYDTMKTGINNGLYKTGFLPGNLQVERKAHIFYQNYLQNGDFEQLMFAYARAMSEENASGGVVVTAPTCGSCGIVPAVLFAYELEHHTDKQMILNALLISGLIGNIVRTNASISGAEVGCQGEVGVACSMAAASRAYLLGANNETIENAAEIALEHHLGLTCDPVNGLVQIPCIERNAMAARAAVAVSEYALVIGGTHYVTLDSVIQVMNDTGRDLNEKYKETSKGGLALRNRGISHE